MRRCADDRLRQPRQATLDGLGGAERDQGGEDGCLPSKNLIEAAKIIHHARHQRFPGLTPAEIGLDFRKLIEQKDEVIHGYRKKKYESLTGGQFRIEKGQVEFVDDHSVQVDGQRFTGEKILIGTGSRPVVPNIQGLRDVPYHERWKIGPGPQAQ
jgi:mercuric reductase